MDEKSLIAVGDAVQKCILDEIRTAADNLALEIDRYVSEGRPIDQFFEMTGASWYVLGKLARAVSSVTHMVAPPPQPPEKRRVWK